MKKTVFYLTLSFVLFFSSSFSAKIDKEKLKTIWELQDSRKPKDKKLLNLLQDKDPVIRARATVAYGSLQDTAAREALLKLLADKNDNVASSAAFALGQTISLMSDEGKASVEKKLFDGKLFRSARMLEEFGKFCTQDGLKKFCETFSSEDDNKRIEAMMLGIARAAIRNITVPEATKYVLRNISGTEVNVRRAASYALQRIGSTQEMKDSLDKLTMLQFDTDPFVRMNAAALYGKFQNQEDAQKTVMAIVPLAENDNDWRVRVNATKSLGKLNLSVFQGILFSLIPLQNDSNEHVSLTAISSLGNIGSLDSIHDDMEKELWESLLKMVKNDEDNYSFRQQGEAAVVLAKLFGAKAEEYVQPGAKIAELVNAKYIEAISYAHTTKSFQTLLDYTANGEPIYARTAIEGLQTYLKKEQPNSHPYLQAREKIVDALKSKDIAVVTTAASALGDSLFANEGSVHPLIEAYEEQKYPAGIEVMQEIIATLGKIKSEKAASFLDEQLHNHDRTLSLAAANALKEITGKDYSAKVTQASKPVHQDYDWKYLLSLKDTTKVELVTSKGSIFLNLFVNDAPFTVMNFLKLAKKGFYSNTFFHRVVSNFVIQGGDPRGDGWGGPDYTIRSEFSLLKYDSDGVVGVASAGKDTEGSQFFITHAATPHLDGRYTIFGKVTKGMDVVNTILVGDQVTEVKILK